MKPVLHLWLALSCAACAFFGAKVYVLKNQVNVAAQSKMSAHAGIQQEIEKIKRLIAEADAERKAGEAQLPGRKPKKPTELSDRERLDRVAPSVDEMRLDPRNRQHLQLDNRRMVQWEYGDLFAELNLPRKKLERFKQLLGERKNAGLDALNYSILLGLSSSTPTSRNAIEHAEASIDQEILGLLGEIDFKVYQEYNRVWRDTLRLENFQTTLKEENVPALDKAQLRALATACCDVADKERNPDYAAIANDTGGAVATTQILQRVSPPLTAEQVQAYIAYREASDAAEKASERFIRGEAPLPTLSKAQ